MSDLQSQVNKDAARAGAAAQGVKQELRGDVAKTPVKAVLIAAAVGLLIGQLLALAFGV